MLTLPYLYGYAVGAAVYMIIAYFTRTPREISRIRPPRDFEAPFHAVPMRAR